MEPKTAPLARSVDNTVFQGLPCIRLRLPQGDAATVALHGAQVLSWVAGGRERLYLSPKAVFDGQSAIRGGVPVCFPQFNQRGPLPKHGFARNLSWTEVPATGLAAGASTPLPEDSAQVSLGLCADDATRTLWPQAFEATLTVKLRPGSLQVTLAVHNTDARSLRFTGALHTYLAVDDISAARLGGLQGQPCWDALTDRQGQASGDIPFNGEFDRVYKAAPTALTLHDGPLSVLIAQSASFTDTVVWNPGAALCSHLADMPADGFARMLCVEAAQVMSPVEVATGETWQGWQRLTVL
jgi:glucose-6-phosphate 1-epimerase